MKNLLYNLLFSFTFMGLVSSCSSDNSPIDNSLSEPQVQIVTLNVTGEFTESNTLMRSISASAYQLKYIVHNKTTGALVKIREIAKGVTTIQDTLVMGDYKVSLLATASDNISGIILRSNDLLNYKTAMADINEATEYDMFYGTFDMQVGALPVVDIMTLHRIVGKIEVFVEDAVSIPANIQYVQLSISKYLPSGFRLWDEQTIFEEMGNNSQLAVTSVLSRQDFISAQNAQFQLYLLDNSPAYNVLGNASDLYVALLDRAPWEAPNKTYLPIKKNLSSKRNQTIKLSGNLFNKNMSLDDIQIDDEWKEAVKQSFDLN